MTLEVAEAMAEMLRALRPSSPHYVYMPMMDRDNWYVGTYYVGPGRGFKNYGLYGPNGIAQHIRDEMFYDLEVISRAK